MFRKAAEYGPMGPSSEKGESRRTLQGRSIFMRGCGVDDQRPKPLKDKRWPVDDDKGDQWMSPLRVQCRT